MRTRPYTPRTNGKAECFMQTLRREWAYRFSYTSADDSENGSRRTCTSTTITERIHRSATTRRSVAWIGRTS